MNMFKAMRDTYALWQKPGVEYREDLPDSLRRGHIMEMFNKTWAG